MANRVTTEQKKIVVELGYVEFADNINMTGSWKCKKCGLERKGRPNRIMSHLLCMEDRGVKICKHMKKNPDEKEELARRLGRDPYPEKTSSTNGMSSEMLISIHQGQSSQPDSTQPSFPQANPDQREELAGRLAETTVLCSQMIDTRHQEQFSQSDATQPFFSRANPDEMEEHARGLGRNPQPEQIVIPIEETLSIGDLLEYNNDGVEEASAVGSEMINTTHRVQSSQPDSTQSSFSQGGMDMCMDDPMRTPSHNNFYPMYYPYIPPSQDGATVDPSMAASSVDIEGRQQQQLQPGEEGNIVNNVGGTENTSSRAVIINVCSNREDCSNVPDLGSAGCEGGASPDVRMQNAVSPEKRSKRRKCAPGSRTSTTSFQHGDSVSDFISSRQETPDASMLVPQETCTPPSNGQERACVPNTNNGVVQGTNDVDFEPNNTIHHGTGEEGRGNGIGQIMPGAGSCQPQASTSSAQHLRFTSDTVQPTDRQDVARASITNLDEMEAVLREMIREHLQATLASGAGQQEFHGSTLSSQNQPRTDTEPPAPSQVRSSMQSTGNLNLFDSGPSQGTEDFASLADRFRKLAQTEVHARRELVQNMLCLVRKFQTLTSRQADLKTQLEETESVTVTKRKQEVDNWLRHVDQAKEEVVEKFNYVYDAYLSFRGCHSHDGFSKFSTSARNFENSHPVLVLLGGKMMAYPLRQITQQNFLEATFSLEDLERNILRATSSLKDLKSINDRISTLETEVDELLGERKLPLEPTVDMVLHKKNITCQSQLQHFVGEHFKLILETTGHGIKCRS